MKLRDVTHLVAGVLCFAINNGWQELAKLCMSIIWHKEEYDKDVTQIGECNQCAELVDMSFEWTTGVWACDTCDKTGIPYKSDLPDDVNHQMDQFSANQSNYYC